MSTTYAETAPKDIPPPGGEAVIALRGVTKRFGSHTVLKDLTFDVPRGKISAVLGPSGTGKSVLLKNIIGLLRPEEGQIYVDGEPIVGIRHKDMLRIRRKFGVLFQDGALFGSMDIFDNIAFPLREHTNRTEREIKARVMEKAEMVGMVAHLNKLPGEISGGMRKRAGLARALILDPEIVFFDEPDSGLDPVRVAYLDELVKSVQKEIGCTFFIITHNIESVKRTADYIGMLYRSSLVRFGPARDMFVSDRALVKQFLAGSSVGPIGMDEMVDAARGDADVAALLADEEPAPAGGGPGPAPSPSPSPSPVGSRAPGRTKAGSSPTQEPTTDVLPVAGEHEDGHLDDGWVPPGVEPADERTARLPEVDAGADTRAVTAVNDLGSGSGSGSGSASASGSGSGSGSGSRGAADPEPENAPAGTGRGRRLTVRRGGRPASAGTAPAKPRTRSPKPDPVAGADRDGELQPLEDLDPEERRQLEEEEALFRRRNG